ncbi:hypothetical protein [Ancylobacter vacuolatus]|uniref:DNA-directed RNA polymerase subunit F n=1 Tax=Ancylobacter vacuolatus TaxID=223389 RepID=A0ABU0DLW0_9HYPH|nr:hypothetical protein [Ancylobacter vacuolatus]MDQ0349385.1 DNA-directed RNA polymerase subunit F [Ancylobacter vacuolatus]
MPTLIPATRATNDELRDTLERQVAAKICAMLPPDDEAARRILAHAGVFLERFTSIAAIRAYALEG